MNDDRPVVLVIDDDPALCAMVEQMLDEEGYAVEIATDVVTGAQRAAAGGVDVVLLDLMLRGIEAAADSPVAVPPVATSSTPSRPPSPVASSPCRCAREPAALTLRSARSNPRCGSQRERGGLGAIYQGERGVRG